MVYENTPQEHLKIERWKALTNDKLLFQTYVSEQEWKNARKFGLGGSDVGACMGLNPYMSKYQIYLAKAIGKEVNLDGNHKVQKGKILEPYIYTEFVKPYFEKTGYVPVICKDSIIDKSKPHYRVNVDGLYFTESDDTLNPQGVIEIKLVFEHSEDKWFGKEYQGIPAHYYAQVQWYMHVLNIFETTVCAFFDRTWTPNFFTISYDEEFVVDMVRAADEIWECKCTMTPPMLDPELDKEYILDAFDKKDSAMVYMYSESQELNYHILQYKTLSAEIKEREKLLNMHKGELVNAYLKGRIPQKSVGTVSMSKITRQDIDPEKIKANVPGYILDTCYKFTEYMRTTIKCK